VSNVEAVRRDAVARKHVAQLCLRDCYKIQVEECDRVIALCDDYEALAKAEMP
jgi:hypothetical protein